MAKSDNRSILGIVEEPKPAPQSSPTASRERRYEVMEAIEVPSGASNFLLPKGHVVSSFGYDIEHLRRHGVRLREIQ